MVCYKICFLVFVCVSLCNICAVPIEELFKLRVIHYNDFHARFEETSLSSPTCRTNNDSCLGGFARLYYEITELLEEDPDAVLLNAGDSFQGTYFYTYLKWEITQLFMNMLPHDAHAIGNHEFDDGPEILAPYLATLQSTVVCANMNATSEPLINGLFQPSVVIERNGRQIGIIGLITVDTKLDSDARNVTFSDPIEAARKEAEYLNEKGVNIIIVLSHCGLDVDKEIANKTGHLIDIIVGGHTHSLLWNGKTPSGEGAAGPYPIIVHPSNDKEHNVLIVQASAYTKYLGNMTVYFDSFGNYVKWEGGPIFLNRSIPEDPDIKRQLEPYALLVREAENQKVGSNDRFLNSDDCVYGECALGDILVDAYNEQAKDSINSKYPYLSFMQRGNIKSSLSTGEITAGMIFELVPFQNRLLTFELQGEYVRQALERSVSSAWAIEHFKGPYVLQVSGLRVTYNISQPEGSRIVNVSIGEDTSATPLDKDSIYQVTVSAYLAKGGDGFDMFSRWKRNVKQIGQDQNVIENYIKNNSPLNAREEGRIVITY